MTDEEIKKTLECCSITHDCSECYLCDFRELGTGNCVNLILTKAYELINRQQAEIERLNEKITTKDESNYYFMGQLRTAREELQTTKHEAVKEFAEHLRKRIYVVCGRCAVDVAHINMVEKMLLEGGVNND